MVPDYSVVPSDSMRTSSPKLKHKKLHLSMRNGFINLSVVEN